MAFDVSAASNILKTRYLGPIRKQLNQSTFLLSRLGREDNAIAVSGKSFTIPLHTSRNRAAGIGRADGGTLPTAGQQGFDVAVIPIKYQYGRIQVTGPAIAASRDNVGAFVKALDSEIEGLSQDFKRSFNRQMHGDGVDALAFWTTTDDSSGVTIDDSLGNPFVHLEAGQDTTCDLIDASNNSSKLGDSIVVTLGAKASTNYAATFTGSVSGSADGDYLVLEDTLGYQLMGIQGIIDDANPTLLGSGLHGLAVASKAFWKAQVAGSDSSLTSLTLDAMQQPLDLIAQNSFYDETGVKFLLTSHEVRRKYVDLLVADRRHVNTMELDGGFKAVDFDGISLVVDSQCRKNRIYYVNPETIKLFRMSDFDWLDKDGSYLSRVSNTDAYEAVMFWYGDVGCIARNANAVLKGISA